MRIKPALYGILVLGLFAGTVAVAAAAGVWQTTGRTASGTGAGSGAGSGAALTGQTTTALKGWMAIGDVAAAWSIPLPEILAAFDLPADTASATALKDLESDFFSVPNLRDWLDARSGRVVAPTASVKPQPSP